MTFRKGETSNPNGRRKGAKTKKKVLARNRLSWYLEKNDVVVEDYIAKAIKSADVPFLRALEGLLPYMQPRIMAEQAPQPKPKVKAEVPTGELLGIVIAPDEPVKAEEDDN